MTLRVLVIVLLVLSGWASVGQAEDRFALLIGNSKYQSEKAGDLPNPVRDVDAVEKSLKKLGFTVTKKKNLTFTDTQKAIVEFNRQLTPGSAALFYFAGHGLQLNNKNYLVPVDAQLREEFEVKSQCVMVEYLLDAMGHSRSNLNVVILDCCRNNPFARSWSRNTSGSGLAPVKEIPKGTLIAFSTAPGKLAKDGKSGSNSPYATALTKVLDTRPPQGLELVRAIRLASQEVKKLTGQTQTPYLTFEASIRDFYFWAPGKVPGTPVPPLMADTLQDGKTAGQIWDNNSLKIRFRWCPPGNFKMGTQKKDVRFYQNQDPVSVKLTKGFWMGETEVTQSTWQLVMNTTPWKGEDFVKDGPNYPAVHVSYHDAVEFCTKLTTIGHQEGWLPKGRMFALPTEAQWEYACRAGTTTAYSFGADEDQLKQYGWYDGNAWDIDEKYAHEVGTKKSNPWGVSDLHGNVWEWCQDWYFEKLPGGTAPAVLIKPPAEPKSVLLPGRVIRGGGYRSFGDHCRSAYRNVHEPAGRFSGLGFRVTVSLAR